MINHRIGCLFELVLQLHDALRLLLELLKKHVVLKLLAL